MDNYIVINGKKAELTEEQLNSLCMFNRFAQMAKEQFGLTITQKEIAGETFKTLFGIDFSDCSERKNPFERRYGKEYFIISENDSISSAIDRNFNDDNIAYKKVNHFNDYEFTKQVILHQLLNRKLLKYAWDNEAEDCEWDDNNTHYYIYFDSKNCNFKVDLNTRIRSQNIYFSKKKVAEQAIKDVVEPFMIEYPEFVW